MKSISIFGSTGSIGKNALKYLKKCSDNWCIHTITAGNNIDLLIEQAIEFKPKYAVVENNLHYEKLKQALNGTDVIAKAGIENIIESASNKCDIVLMAITGVAALNPLIHAIKAGSNIALANKESIVCGGDIVLNLAKKHNVNIIPIDSEHNGIFQLIENQAFTSIDKIYLTASGGPFLKFLKSDLDNVTQEQALNHPTWKMGKKISIDSATMVNKSLEFIEAHYLFNLSADKIEIIIHPESIIHAIVSFCDGIFFASLNSNDMIIPIAHALNYPKRLKHDVAKIDFVKLASLDFKELDLDKFNAVKFAKECVTSGNKSVNCNIFNLANEVAVASFLNNEIKFTDITKVIEKCLNQDNSFTISNIDDIYELDSVIRQIAKEIINDL